MLYPTPALTALEGGRGSGNFGHAGRKGKLGGSGKGAGTGVEDEWTGTEDVREFYAEKMTDFDSKASKWLRSSDTEAREEAFDTAINDITFRAILMEDAFKKPFISLPKTVPLYRVGPVRPGINSFFITKAAAKAYQKRLDFDKVEKYEGRTMRIVPSGSGAGEVWAKAEDLE